MAFGLSMKYTLFTVADIKCGILANYIGKYSAILEVHSKI